MSGECNNSEYDDYSDFEIEQPPPNKKYRVTPKYELNDLDLLAPTILGSLLPIPSPPKPETKESVEKLLAPYKQKIIKLNEKRNNIYHPRISVIKHKTKKIKNNTSSSNTTSKASSESTINSGYITVYDIPDPCWSLIFHFCDVDNLVFNIAATNKFFQSLIVDTSTWIHRKVTLPTKIYKKSLPKLVLDTLESIFLNWTSLKQLDIMLDCETDPDRVTFIWRLLCTPRPKIETLRIGNSINLPGGDTSAVNETAFKYLKLIQDIEILDFSFNMFHISYDSIIQFFAYQAQQNYIPTTKPKRNNFFNSTWNKQKKKNKKEKEKKNTNNNSNIVNLITPELSPNINTNTEHQTISNILDENEHRENEDEQQQKSEKHISPSLEILKSETKEKEKKEQHKVSKEDFPKTPIKRRKYHKITPFDDDEESDYHDVMSLNDNNHNTNNRKSYSSSFGSKSEPRKCKKKSVLGKRPRQREKNGFLEMYQSPISLNKNKKSMKREMDSDDDDDIDDIDDIDNNEDDKNDKNDKEIDCNKSCVTFPGYGRQRKRRKTSDSMSAQQIKIKSKRKKDVSSKQELSISPPPSFSLLSPSFNTKRVIKRKRMRRSSLTPISASRCRKRQNLRKRRLSENQWESFNVISPNNDYNRHNMDIPKLKKEIITPKEFGILSSTPSPITSPIIDDDAFNSSVYGKKMRKTILSNIDPSLMSTLKDLNNDELELNLSLTLNIDSIDIGLNDNDNNNNDNNDDNDRYYESYRENLYSDYAHIDKKKGSMKDLGRKSKLRRIYFRELCCKAFPDLAYNYLNIKRIESLSLYTGDTSSLIAFIDKCGKYPIIKKIEIDGTSPFRWRCAPLCESLTKCINLCSIQLPSIVDAVDIIAFDSFLNAAINLSEIGLVTGDRQLFKPIHDVINKHGFKMDINTKGLRFIFAKRKNKPKLRANYHQNKKKFIQKTRSS